MKDKERAQGIAIPEENDLAKKYKRRIERVPNRSGRRRSSRSGKEKG